MKRYATIDKKEGETPLEALARLRVRDAISSETPLAYAGRLDPMASGKLLVLIGEECKKQTEYHALDKEYEFEILLGLKTDTGDILGLIEIDTNPKALPSDSEIKKVIKTLIGTISLPYPHFSSKTVRGKPLFLWTLEKRLHEIEIPVAHTQIHALSYRGHYTFSGSELLDRVEKRIATITPVTEESKALGENFRRKPILAAWKAELAERGSETFHILTFTTTCSSGTYIRSLAPKIAELLGTTGLAYMIHRTKIGTYLKVPLTPWGIWTRLFK